MISLPVRVTDDFTLNAGTLYPGKQVFQIQPPSRRLFDQLCDHLAGVKASATQPRALPPSVLGIAATALCLKWGTLLGFLWDANKPVHPAVHEPGRGLLNESEMARINVELSANLASLLSLHQSDPQALDRLLWAAYCFLPMPWRKVKPQLGTARVFRTLLAADCATLDLLRPRVPAEVLEHPTRAYANAIASHVWRNGSPLEDIQAGVDPLITLTERRASREQENAILRYIAECLGPVLSSRQPWESAPTAAAAPWPDCIVGLSVPLILPADWTLTEESRTVTLAVVEHSQVEHAGSFKRKLA